MARRPTVSIIGCGRAGGAIGLALKEAGYPIAAAWSRSRTGRQRAHLLLEVPILTRPDEVARAADVTIVAVPDDAIAEVAVQLAPGVREDAYVIHTSGGVSVDALAPAAKAGARVGSVHPLQTLPGPRAGAEALRGAAVAVTCELRDRMFLFRLARAWGGRPFSLPDEAKALYHAAAVFASNYIVTSVWAATQLMRAAGVRNSIPLLAPLIETTARNTIDRGPERALTGPIARGDARAVRRHVKALRDTDPTSGRIVDAYRALAQLTANMVGADSAFEKPPA